MVKLNILCILTCFLIFYACSNVDVKKFDNQVYNENKFIDPDLQSIYQSGSIRKTWELSEWLDDKNPEYREAAALILASVQDTTVLDKLFELLETDKSIRVRMASAFAIGQANDSLAENRLFELAAKEKSEKVAAKIYEAIGKCATRKGHDKLLQILKDTKDNNSIKPILMGLSRFSIRGIASDSGISQIVRIISDNMQPEENRYLASVYLIRLKGFDLSKYSPQIIQGFDITGNLYSKINLILSLSRAQCKESFTFLNTILNSDYDSRIRINAIRSLSNFQYSEIGKPLLNSLNDSDVNVAIQASEYFLSKGIKQDAQIYFNKAKTLKNRRVRTNLFQVAVKLAPQKSEMVKYIVAEYKRSDNTYEKAGLLKALEGDFESFEFIRDEIKNTKEFPVGTAGMEALTDMRRSKGFDLYTTKLILTGNKDLNKEFADVFKEAILSGDVAKTGIAAEIIRDPELNFREQYKNSYFLNQALNNCKLPAEIETYRELQKTISFINGAEYKEQANIPIVKIDWDYISKIPYNQKVEIKTDKGDIVLELYVNDAPVSVANFLKLISLGYYNNKVIHRVVPNFVIQDGCPRGDGWGGPDYTICSEFSMNYFAEGCLGMASAGKDTESSQWFITHSPTPHLDGRYTNFGKVIKGMDVVLKLEIGDRITGMKIFEERK